MKKTLLAAFLISALLSCKKESGMDDIKSKISGTWELRKSICAKCFISYTIYPPGNGITIAMSSNGTFERRQHDTLLFRGNYTLSKNKQCNKTLGDIAFSTNESLNAIPLYVTIKSDTLAFNTPYCDPNDLGMGAIYVRIK